MPMSVSIYIDADTLYTVLRTDGVLRLVLNTNLFKGMDFEIAQDPRYVKFGLIQDKKVVLHALRVGQPLFISTSRSPDRQPTVGEREACRRLAGAGQSEYTWNFNFL